MSLLNDTIGAIASFAHSLPPIPPGIARLQQTPLKPFANSHWDGPESSQLKRLTHARNKRERTTKLYESTYHYLPHLLQPRAAVDVRRVGPYCSVSRHRRIRIQEVSTMIKADLTVAVVGATGAAGEEMIQVLSERRFPVKQLVPLASKRTAGTTIEWRGDDVVVQELNDESFEGVDVALFSAGAEVSLQYGPIAAAAGAVVIDNSRAFRMDPEVPLVVPEVNPDALNEKAMIIANPNCSTIQKVAALQPYGRRP